jgi:DNA-binding MarR family transcriptional regulator/N-acetylglutamate synthase-like GNAT family acetyltransferase
MDYLDPRIAAVRRFNRFWTARIGVLREALLDGPFSLTETRILYELAHRDGVTAADLARELDLDSGYLSRILRGFDKAGLLERSVDPADGRKARLRLSGKGRAEFGPIETRSSMQAAKLLAGLPEQAARDVVQAMRRIEQAFAAGPRGWVLRGLQPGDLGWVVARHGAIYAHELGWDATFEHLVAKIAGELMERFDPATDGAWIAELDGVPVGSVFLIRQGEGLAKLRLLIVDPAARGLGIGARLVVECTRFARLKGYRRITLWTHAVLTAARHLYAQEGYRLVASEPMQAFGQSLVSETWELDLSGG